MSPYPSRSESPGLARVAAQIEALRSELVPRLERIERQVERTNGRVTALELHDAHEAGAQEERDNTTDARRHTDARHWQIRMALFGAILGFATAISTAIVLAYLTPIFPTP